SAVIQEIEERVWSYFADMRLLQEPTLYDHLVLSLRPRDVIATFNWDPFLADAVARNVDRAPMPQMLFLHGNVRVGRCSEHGIKYLIEQECDACGAALEPTRLLFPIRKKDYASDPIVQAQWDHLKFSLREAFTLTIFGYGAPTTDVEALELMG